jgi:UDP-N-acetylglucosamine 2-epimerase (non-hydrolysing)
MTKLKEVIKKEDPRLLLIEGDTNSVSAAALTGLKMGVKIGHVEAGLRSYDWRMPEEHNRIIVDHISDLLFAPTDRARENLERENVHGRIYVTGNTVIDAVVQHMPLAERSSKIIDKIRFSEYILMTAHRAENVDDPNVLKNLAEVCIDSPLPVVFPVHPRTAKRLKEYGLYNILKRCSNVQLLPPVGYLDFLMLMKHCKLILTDSGGLQEEATAPCIKKKVLVLRLSTERPEAVEKGFAKVVGVDKDVILQSIKEELNSNNPLSYETPFGDGNAGRRIVDIIEQYVGSR